LSRTRVPDAAFTPSRHHRQTLFEDGRPGASLVAGESVICTSAAGAPLRETGPSPFAVRVESCCCTSNTSLVWAGPHWPPAACDGWRIDAVSRR